MGATPPNLQVLPPLQGTCWLGLGVLQSALPTARQSPQSGSAAPRPRSEQPGVGPAFLS